MKRTICVFCEHDLDSHKIISHPTNEDMIIIKCDRNNCDCNGGFTSLIKITINKVEIAHE